MKKILLVITLSLTLFLSGCNTKEDKLQDVLNRFEDFVDDVMMDENVDIEKGCESIFAGDDDIQQCIEEFNPLEDDFEKPFFYEVSLTLLEFEEFSREDLDIYSEVYLVTFEATLKVQPTDDSEIYTQSNEQTGYIVKVDSTYKLLMLYPSNDE